MNRFNFIIFLAFIFVTDFSLAQVPSCPCDTLDVNGISGNEIIELVCPGGELAVGASGLKLLPHGSELVAFPSTRGH